MRPTGPTAVLWLALISLGTSAAQERAPSVTLVESKDAKIEYHSVAEALASLKARKDVTVSTAKDGWLIISEKKNPTTWSFAPDSDPAHPTVVKTVALGNWYFDFAVRCEAKKETCDQFLRKLGPLHKQLN